MKKPMDAYTCHQCGESFPADKRTSCRCCSPAKEKADERLARTPCSLPSSSGISDDEPTCRECGCAVDLVHDDDGELVCYTCKGSGKARPAGLSKYVKMPDDGCGEWIAAPDNGGDIGDLLDIAEELNGLLIALHDAIDRPKGVVPESAEKFYQPNVKEHAPSPAGAVDETEVKP